MFGILPRERGMFYQAVQGMWCEYKSARGLGILRTVISSYMTYNVHLGTAPEREVIKKGAQIKCNVTTPGAFLRCARYRRIERSAYLWMAFGCGGSGALLCVPQDTNKSWYAIDILWPILNMTVDPVLA